METQNIVDVYTLRNIDSFLKELFGEKITTEEVNTSNYFKLEVKYLKIYKFSIVKTEFDQLFTLITSEGKQNVTYESIWDTLIVGLDRIFSQAINETRDIYEGLE